MKSTKRVTDQIQVLSRAEICRPGTNALMLIVMTFVVTQRSSMPLGYKLLTTMKAEKSLYNHVWLVMKNVAAVKLFRYFCSMEYLLMSNDASNDASVFSSHLLALSGSK